jgi:hypothetical protein
MTDPNAVPLAPFEVLQPIAVAVIGAIATGLVGIGIAAIRKWTGLQISTTYQEQLEKAAAIEAGKLVAAAADNLANASIPSGSPMVKAIAQKLFTEEHLAQAIDATGMTTDRIAALIVGELGKLQAHMTYAPVGRSEVVHGHR